ncbi:hypothetical protein PVK06_018385 [Gossypium arboreum]|uniref:Reverse transcriptase n=1 Tax=Gossypium arboreum TaxID=29729 RepID=A0ABR0Q586_GOSAR|nr:hypothetical protein PVK06_018385 [Gossypium arboreum]
MDKGSLNEDRPMSVDGKKRLRSNNVLPISFATDSNETQGKWNDACENVRTVEPAEQEKQWGRFRDKRQMGEFRAALDGCNLIDLGYQRCWYIWESGNFASNNIRKRLDRGVANLNWSNLFPNYRLMHLDHSYLDHCPILLDFKALVNSGDTFAFKFEMDWLLDDSCEIEIKALWNSNKHLQIPGRLLTVGPCLNAWASKNKKEKGRCINGMKRLLKEQYNAMSRVMITLRRS